MANSKSGERIDRAGRQREITEGEKEKKEEEQEQGEEEARGQPPSYSQPQKKTESKIYSREKHEHRGTR